MTGTALSRISRRYIVLLAAAGALGLIGCVAVLGFSTEGSDAADLLREIPPYGGAGWESVTERGDVVTALYRTTASQSEVLNHYGYQFADQGFSTMTIRPGTGESLSDYDAPHPRITMTAEAVWGQGRAPYTYLNGLRHSRDDIGEINAQLDRAENYLTFVFGDIWFDYRVAYLPAEESGDSNRVTVVVSKHRQRAFGN